MSERAHKRSCTDQGGLRFVHAENHITVCDLIGALMKNCVDLTMPCKLDARS